MADYGLDDRDWAVNIVRHALRLTDVPQLHAPLGGLHLNGAFFAPSIGLPCRLSPNWHPICWCPDTAPAGRHSTRWPPRCPIAGSKAAVVLAAGSAPREVISASPGAQSPDGAAEDRPVVLATLKIACH